MSRTLCALVVTTVMGSGLLGQSPDVLKIGVANNLLSDVSPEKFQGISKTYRRVLSAQSQLQGELLLVPSPEELRRQILEGIVHMGVLRGVDFGAVVAKQADFIPVVVNIQDPDQNRSVIVVAKTNAGKLEDYRGKTIVLPSADYEDTRAYLEKRCSEVGTPMAKYFGEKLKPGLPEEALDSVIDGQAELTVVEFGALKTFERRKPGRAARLKTLEQSDPFPPSVIVYRKGALDESTVNRFRDGMKSAHITPDGQRLMSLLRCERFDVPPADYLKAVKQAAEKYAQAR